MSVLLVGPAASGLVYPAVIRGMGMRVAVITTDDAGYRLPEEVRTLVDRIEILDAWDGAAALEAARELHTRRPFTGIVAGEEFVVQVTAEIAAELGLRGASPAAARAVRDKRLTREILAAAGVRLPAYARASGIKKLTDAAEHIGFPCVVKPPNLSASLGVSLVRDENELAKAYAAVRQVLDRFRWLHRDPEPGFSHEPEVLVEEYLAGTEYSVDGYVCDGPAQVVCATEAVLGDLPHFQVVGHIARRPTDLPQWPVIRAYVASVVEALELTYCAFHSEVIVTDSGPVLVEIHARLAGHRLDELVRRVTGVHIPRTIVAACTGGPIPANDAPSARIVAKQFIVAPHLAGSAYQELRGWRQAISRPGVLDSRVLVEPGGALPQDDVQSYLAFIEYTAENESDARNMWRETVAAVTVV